MPPCQINHLFGETVANKICKKGFNFFSCLTHVSGQKILLCNSHSVLTCLVFNTYTVLLKRENLDKISAGGRWFAPFGQRRLFLCKARGVPFPLYFDIFFATDSMFNWMTTTLEKARNHIGCVQLWRSIWRNGRLMKVDARIKKKVLLWKFGHSYTMPECVVYRQNPGWISVPTFGFPLGGQLIVVVLGRAKVRPKLRDQFISNTCLIYFAHSK